MNGYGQDSYGLGDCLHDTLTSFGVTPDLVERWIGKPCGCRERQEKLNALGNWLQRVMAGRTDRAREYLIELMEAA